MEGVIFLVLDKDNHSSYLSEGNYSKGVNLVTIAIILTLLEFIQSKDSLFGKMLLYYCPRKEINLEDDVVSLEEESFINYGHILIELNFLYHFIE